MSEILTFAVIALTVGGMLCFVMALGYALKEVCEDIEDWTLGEDKDINQENTNKTEEL